MRAENKVHERHVQAARQRTGQNGDFSQLPDSLHLRRADDDPFEYFPYLERIMAGVRKYPYAALGAMIAIAGVIIAAVVTLAVSLFTGMFLMYGQLRETTAKQEQIQSTLMAIQKQQTDDMNAVRAYESNVSRRTEFIVGLMTPANQRSVAEYDRGNPKLDLPNTQRKD